MPRPAHPLDQLAAPVAPRLRRAAVLSVAAALIWPAQAAVIAMALGGLIAPGAGLSAGLAAAGFIVLAGARAALEARAQHRAIDGQTPFLDPAGQARTRVFSKELCGDLVKALTAHLERHFGT